MSEQQAMQSKVVLGFFLQHCTLLEAVPDYSFNHGNVGKVGLILVFVLSNVSAGAQ